MSEKTLFRIISEHFSEKSSNKNNFMLINIISADILATLFCKNTSWMMEMLIAKANRQIFIVVWLIKKTAVSVIISISDEQATPKIAYYKKKHNPLRRNLSSKFVNY